jgi:hypothetical protein
MGAETMGFETKVPRLDTLPESGMRPEVTGLGLGVAFGGGAKMR